MRKSITLRNQDFLKDGGFETLHVYGGQGKYNFSFFTFCDKNLKSRQFISSKDLLAEDIEKAIEKIKKIIKTTRW
jgi:hypothetical protein